VPNDGRGIFGAQISRRPGLGDHLEETRKQIGRLEQVFKLIGEHPKAVKCPAIDGLIDEANETAGETDDKSVLDAALVTAAQAADDQPQ
jgi:ferritin-like metal-binding protein YciE